MARNTARMRRACIALRPAGLTASAPSRGKIVGSKLPSAGYGQGHLDDPELYTFDGPMPGTSHLPDDFYRVVRTDWGWFEEGLTYMVSVFAWYWLFYNLYHHIDAYTGEYDIPYLDDFTDAELGIPPDDADDPEYWGEHEQFRSRRGYYFKGIGN